MEQHPVICRKLSKIYQQGQIKIPALVDVDLVIPKGDFVCLSGPSGSGKSTLLNLVSGLDSPTSGEIELDGQRVEQMSQSALADMRLHKIGFVFQSYNLIPVLSAQENVEFIMQLQGVSSVERAKKSRKLLKEVGLEGLENRRPGDLSGGQQQRVAVARAIVSEPSLILADEPTANLDSHTAESLMELLRTMNEEHGVTFLFSTHDKLVMNYSKRLIQLHDVVLKAMMFKKYQFNILLYFLVLAGSVVAFEDDEWSFGGHIKYQFAATDYPSDNLYARFGSELSKDNFVDFRVNAEKRWGAWETKIHYEVLAINGDTPKTRRALSNAGLGDATVGLPKDDYRLFKLTDELGHSNNLDAVQRLDRLFVGYNGEQLVVRAGRQAISWGNGLVFHPLDIFSPFSPTEIDKDYKTGDDMLYGQWLFDSGDDLQLILLPRRNLENNRVESEQSSLAFKYHGRYQEQWDFDLVAARHFDENVFGLGISRNIFEALWRLDISATDLKMGGTAVSFITNMDYSWVWFERNFYGFIEYFRNGVGETDSAKYLSPDPALQTRFERGEIYTFGRDYFSSGVQIELNPLFNLYTTWISNLHDSSGIFQIRGIYDWSENLQLIMWLDEPYGDKETEFGGIPSPERRAYLRLIYHF